LAPESAGNPRGRLGGYGTTDSTGRKRKCFLKDNDIVDNIKKGSAKDEARVEKKEMAAPLLAGFAGSGGFFCPITSVFNCALH
jgi:hypothetical protein